MKVFSSAFNVNVCCRVNTREGHQELVSLTNKGKRITAMALNITKAGDNRKYPILLFLLEIGRLRGVWRQTTADRLWSGDAEEEKDIKERSLKTNQMLNRMLLQMCRVRESRGCLPRILPWLQVLAGPGRGSRLPARLFLLGEGKSHHQLEDRRPGDWGQLPPEGSRYCLHCGLRDI